MEPTRPHVLALACLLVSACADPGPFADSPLVTFQARVDGELFVLEPPDVVIDFGPDLYVSGTKTYADGSSREVTLRIVDWSGIGTYRLGGSTAPAGAFVRDRAPNGKVVELWETTDADIGEIDVNSFDETRVAGTFRFTATNGIGELIETTEGEFYGDYGRGYPNPPWPSRAGTGVAPAAARHASR